MKFASTSKRLFESCSVIYKVLFFKHLKDYNKLHRPMQDQIREHALESLAEINNFIEFIFDEHIIDIL